MSDPAVLICYCHLPCPTCHGNVIGTVPHQPAGHVHVSDVRNALAAYDSASETAAHPESATPSETEASR